MNAPLPPPIRAAAGLVARTLDDVRALPTRLLSLPVLAAGTAMQVSMRLQQEYAALIARGDEVLLQLRGESDDVPAWATFDADDMTAGTEAATPGVDPGAVGLGAVLPDGSVMEPAATVETPVVPTPEPAASATKPVRKRAPRKATARPTPLGAVPSAFDLVPDTEPGADADPVLTDPVLTDAALTDAALTDADAAGGSMFGLPASDPAGDPAPRPGTD